MSANGTHANVVSVSHGAQQQCRDCGAVWDRDDEPPEECVPLLSQRRDFVKAELGRLNVGSRAK